MGGEGETDKAGPRFSGVSFFLFSSSFFFFFRCRFTSTEAVRTSRDGQGDFVEQITS